MNYKLSQKTIGSAICVLSSLLLADISLAASKTAVTAEAAQFLDLYNRLYQGLYTVAQEAAWKSSTDVSPEHTGQRIGAEQAQAIFVGNPWVIEKTRALLQQTNKLDDLTIRQLRMIWLRAANSPGTIPDIVTARVTAEARQSATLDGFAFKWQRPGTATTEPLTANMIDDILTTSTNLPERLAVWKASKESGVALRPGLIE